MGMAETDRAHVARQTHRIKAAERRFQRWQAEMQEWGLEVVWPERLTIPTTARRPSYRI